MIFEDKTQFQKEQDELLKMVLDLRYFNPWRKAGREGFDDYSSVNDTSLEIYLTSSCNQKCEYCYLHKYPELYPAEFNKKDLIMKNLKILYDWCIEENMYIPKLDLFCGDIWQWDWGLEFFQVTWDAIERGLNTPVITIPSNCSFLRDWEQTCKIQKWIDKFRDRGVYVGFSISVDGKPIEDVNRPFASIKDKEKDDEFYERMMMFAIHNNYGFHPMVAAVTIEKWIENHKWWEELFKKYDRDVDDGLMMLEVRNHDWTPEKMQAYVDFMKYLIDRQIMRHNGSVKEFALGLFGLAPSYNSGYVPYSPAPLDTFAGCTVCNSLTVRIGDLAIAPCHRQAYNKFLYGHFKVENDKIVGITANNPQHAIRILMANNNICHLGCDSCEIARYCLKGCYGAQYEATNDPFIPDDLVCQFFRYKWKGLMNYYQEIGVLDALREVGPYCEQFEEIQEFLRFYEKVKD